MVMKTFKDYLIEEAQNEPDNKLRDIEHLFLHHGSHEAVEHTANLLDGIHKKMLGKGSDTKMVSKYNFDPVSFGIHPRTKQYFVAHDLNVPNFSHEDIERNHKGDHHTIGNLKTAFDHLHKILPKNGGVYDGKMYTKDNVISKKNNMNIVTKNMTYSTHKDTAHGKKIANASMGIVVDGHHDGKQFQPLSDKVRASFKDHPDIHNIDPNVKANPNNYSPDEQQAFLNAKKKAEMTYAKMKPEIFDATAGHGPRLSHHIDDMKSKGVEPSVDTYLNSLKNMKSHAKSAEEVVNNRNHFEKMLEFNKHLKDAKNALYSVHHKNSEFAHSVNGAAVEPEGAMVYNKNIAAKFRRT